MISKIKRIIVLLTIITIIPVGAFAAWTGPQDVLSGTWGSGIGQFYLFQGESVDFLPKIISVDKNGIIVIPDEGNKRITIYNPDGTIRNTLFKPSALPTIDNSGNWPDDFVSYPGGNSFTIDCEYQKTANGRKPLKICFVDYSNNILAKVDLAEVFPMETGFVLLKNKTYSLYSPTGQLIKTTNTKPLELGVVSETPLGNGQYKVTVKFPAKEWTIISRGVVPKYTRDVNGNLNGSGTKQAIRYNACGKEIARLTMPAKNTVREEPQDEGDEPTITVIEEYGVPVVAPNGDVYTWKRTPTNYSIIKWTWVDDPNQPTGPDAPANLKALSSTTGIYLTWAASPQDPGCVTSYEVSRGVASGGTFSVVATVDKSVLNYNDTTAVVGTTYYYKLRAKAGNDFSAYTAEASGMR